MLNMRICSGRGAGAAAVLSSRWLRAALHNISVRFEINPINFKYIVGLKWAGSKSPVSNSVATRVERYVLN